MSQTPVVGKNVGPDIIMYVAAKVMVIVCSLLAINITLNSYSTKYSISIANETDPPHLRSMVMTYFMWLCMFVVVGLILAYLLIKTLNMDDNLKTGLVYTAIDTVMSVIGLVIVFNKIASTMYIKKYFLYKIDGLRGIRALADMTKTISIFSLAVPYVALGKGFQILSL
jgi:NADH:ubiquinone oxidoreductase subunit 3 (subunit A)